jgi:receptor protein-tyrosine kinase
MARAKADRIVKPLGGWSAHESGSPARDLRWKTSEILVSLHDRASLAGEQFRKMGIRIEALNESLGGQLKLILVTSPLMGEGKTVTAANLAISLAREEGRRVALVDCDTRNPRVQGLFDPMPSRGMYEMLAKDASIDDAVMRAEGVPLDVLALPRGPARRLDPMPMERLKGVFARLRERYDLVICDAPPVLPVADTAALARQSDGVIVVVRSGRTPRQAVSRTLAGIDRNKLIGFVLNAVSERSVASYYYPYVETGSDTVENGKEDS